MMKQLITYLTLGISIYSTTAVYADNEPTLRKALFSTHTNHNDKDHDTTITVTVSSSDNSMTIAHAVEIEGSSDDSKQYKDGFQSPDIPLPIDAEDVAKAATKGFKVAVCMTPHGGRGRDTWEFNAQLKLVFSDKTNWTASIDNVKLDQDNRCVSFVNH